MTFNKIDVREHRALTRAFLRFSPILIALVLVISPLISWFNYEYKKRDIFDLQKTEIVTAMIDYRNSISDMTSIVRTVKGDYLEALGSGKTADDLTAVLSDALRQYPNVEHLHVMDNSGMETLHVIRQNNDAYVVPTDDLQDKSAKPSYLETTMLGRHQYLFSALTLCGEDNDILIDPDTGLSKPVLRISSPLELNGRRVGYFSIAFLMRDYLDSLRTSLNATGCYVLLMDENGYLFNDMDDANNFGFCFAAGSERAGRTVRMIFPTIDLTAASCSLIENNKVCTYMTFDNIYGRSKDYFLSESASEQLIFLVYYDKQSAYANDLQYNYFHLLASSWQLQLVVFLSLFLLYLFCIFMIFFYDRVRFTDLFSDNRYTKLALKQALRHHQFVNYYQPIINIQDGQVLGIEALSRWRTRDRLLSPSMFMDEILHFRLGQKLDEHVFLTVRKDRKRMEQYPEFENTFISVNCCQQTFNSLVKDPPATLISLTEAEKSYIVLELVENIIFNRATQMRISEMYGHNILFAIDDFGTGNSNIAFIRNLENLKVKIDRTFVPQDLANKKETVIIESFAKMFIDQGLRLIVEGVETREQYLYMKQLGIAGVQGFYFSRPMTIDALIEFMQKREYLNKL